MKLILLCGGPKAGTVIAWHNDPPTTFAFPTPSALKIVKEHLLDGAPLPTSTDQPKRSEYRKGDSIDLNGETIIAYHFIGDDAYRTARTMENLVMFRSPHSLSELEDKIEASWLLFSCGMKVKADGEVKR